MALRDSTDVEQRADATKLALLSMDVEDWYHLEYFQRSGVREPSMLDGVDRFRDLLEASGRIPATFFSVSDVVRACPTRMRALADTGHEIASHGPDHRLVSAVDPVAFARALEADKTDIEQLLGVQVRGYRAPCFSMNREQLQRLSDIGFVYDSSWIRFSTHPLYVAMDLSDWPAVCPGVRRAPDRDFLEFEVPTGRVGRWRFPFAGGAYFRVFPWPLLERVIAAHLAETRVFVAYIHPFECSSQHLGAYPPGTTWGTRLRFQLGRDSVLSHLSRLIAMLRERRFEFVTFSTARARLLG